MKGAFPCPWGCIREDENVADYHFSDGCGEFADSYEVICPTCKKPIVDIIISAQISVAHYSYRREKEK